MTRAEKLEAIARASADLTDERLDAIHEIVVGATRPAHQLTPEQEASFQRGLKQVERGEVVSSEDVFGRIEATLKAHGA